MLSDLLYKEAMKSDCYHKYASAIIHRDKVISIGHNYHIYHNYKSCLL